MTGKEAAAAIHRGDCSATELLQALLGRIERYNPAINAVVALDVERALKRAGEADAARAAGNHWGPLHGVPMTVKDAYEVAGLTSTGGSPEYREHVPERHSHVAQRLTDAGAIIFGKTNVPFLSADLQTFNEVYGTTNNPWDTSCGPGGSSGGSAAALAAGLTPMEFGSDIGGSIRTPAHLCGVYGHKTSLNTVPRRGHIPGPPGALAAMDLGVAGPLARSVDDLELLFSLTAAPNELEAVGWKLELPPARTSKLEDMRIAVWLHDDCCPLDGSVSQVLAQAMDKLANAGARIEEAHPPISLREHHEYYLQMLSPVTGARFPEEVINHLSELAASMSADDDSLQAIQARATIMRHIDWLRVNEQRERIRHMWRAFFCDYDALIAPAAHVAAFPHDQQSDFHARRLTVNGEQRPYMELLIWAGLAVLPLLPATAVPMGLTADGHPVGAQIIGPYLEDMTALAVARAIDEVVQGYSRPPGY